MAKLVIQTVADLIAKLQEMPQDLPVVTMSNGDYDAWVNVEHRTVQKASAKDGGAYYRIHDGELLPGAVKVDVVCVL